MIGKFSLGFIAVVLLLAFGVNTRNYDDIFPEKTKFGYVPIGKNGSKFFYWMAMSRNSP